VDADVTSLMQEGIPDATTRCFVVRAVNADGASLDSKKVCATTYDEPGQPDVSLGETGPLKATLAANGTPARVPGAWFELSWTSADSDPWVPEVEAFDVQRMQVGSPAGWQDLDRTSQNWEVARPPSLGVADTGDALATGEWCYRVQAENLAGTSGWSEPTCGNATPELYPDAPLNLSVDRDLADDEINVSWDAPESEGSQNLFYRVYRASVPSDGFGFECLATTGQTGHDDGTPNLGVRYAYFVTATRDSQASCDSATLGQGGQPSLLDSTVLLDPPRPPRNVDASPGETRGEVHVKWQAPAFDDEHAEVDEYRVKRTDPSESTQEVRTVPAGVTSIDDAVPAEATLFTYEVVAHNESLELTGDASNPDTSIAYGVPLAPDALSVQDTDVVFNGTGHKVLNARLAWTEPARTGGSAIDEYTLRQDLDDDGTIDATFAVDASATDRNVTLACPDVGTTTWAFDVTASNAEHAAASAPSNNKTLSCDAPSPPNAPQKADALPGANRSEVDLSWDPPSSGDDRAPVDRYDVDRREQGESTWTDLATPQSTSLMDAGLADSTVYEYRIRAVNHAHGLISTEVTAKSAPNGPPAAPSNLAVDSTTTFVEDGVQKIDVTLNWTAPTYTGGSALDAYHIDRGYTDESGTSSHTVDASSTQATVTVDCPDAGEITFDVTANNTEYDTQSPASNEDSASCEAPHPPNAPSNLLGTPGDERGEVSLDWDAPSPGDNRATVDEYHVERREDVDSSWTQVDTVTTGTQTTDAPSAEATVYEYRVFAHNTTEEFTSGASSIDDAVANGTPTAPVNFDVDSTSTYFEQGHKRIDVTLEWSAPTRDAGAPFDVYDVREDRDDDGTTSAIRSYEHPSTNPTIKLDCPDTGQTTWAFDVTANNTAYDDHGPASDTQTVACDAPDRPSAPANLSARAGDESGEIRVDWDAPANTDNAPITEYHLDRVDPDGATVEVARLTSPGPYTDTRLAAGTTYTYEVSSHNHPHDLTSDVATDDAVPLGPPSEPHSVTVPDQQTVFVDGQTQLDATLNWAAPNHTGGANVASYTIHADSADAAEDKTVAASPTEADVSLGCSGEWTVTLTAQNTAFDEDSLASNPVTLACSVPRPANVQVQAGVRAIQVDWTGPGNLDYQVLWHTAAIPDGAECSDVDCRNTTDTSESITGLDNATTYHVRVRVTEDGTPGDLASGATAETYGAAENVTAEFTSNPTFAIGGEQPPTIFVNWNHPTQHSDAELGADTYRIERCQLTARTPAASEASSCEIAGNVSGEKTTFGDTGMAPGVYCYTVVPENRVGEPGLASEGEPLDETPTEPIPADCDVYARHDTADEINPSEVEPTTPNVTVTLSYFDGNAEADSGPPPSASCPTDASKNGSDTITLTDDGPVGLPPAGPNDSTRCVEANVTVATPDPLPDVTESLVVGVPSVDAPANVTASLTAFNATRKPTACAGTELGTLTLDEEGPHTDDAPEPLSLSKMRCLNLTVAVENQGQPIHTAHQEVGAPWPDASACLEETIRVNRSTAC